MRLTNLAFKREKKKFKRGEEKGTGWWDTANRKVLERG